MLPVRPLFALLAIALTGAVVSACGKGSAAAPTRTAASDRATALDYDVDNDVDKGSKHDNDLYFGHPATASEVAAAGTVVRHYYAAAARGDSASACGLLRARLASEVPALYGRPPSGPPSLRGDTCQVVLSKMFRQRRHQLSLDSSTLKVTGMFVQGRRGLLLLRFKPLPNGHIFLYREGLAWRLDILLANGPPQK